jgi:hypothetical protein
LIAYQFVTPLNPLISLETLAYVSSWVVIGVALWPLAGRPQQLGLPRPHLAILRDLSVQLIDDLAGNLPQLVVRNNTDNAQIVNQISAPNISLIGLPL